MDNPIEMNIFLYEYFGGQWVHVELYCHHVLCVAKTPEGYEAYALLPRVESTWRSGYYATAVEAIAVAKDEAFRTQLRGVYEAAEVEGCS